MKMTKIKVDTYKKLITFFKFRPEDYEMWDDMLHYYDSDAIDEAVTIWIKTKSKTPTVADIATLAEEIEIKNRIAKKQFEKSKEEQEDANRRLYEESIKAADKGYIILCRYINNERKAFSYSWLHADSLNHYNTYRVKRNYMGNDYFIYFQEND